MEPSSKIEAFPIHIEDKSLEAVSELAQASYAALLRTHKASQAPRASGLEDNFRDGLPPDYIAAFSKYMVTKYDWRKHEKTINAMGQHYRLSIQDVPGEGPMKMHFVHTPSKRQDAIPLCLIHGWPGSFYEFKDLVPLLTDPPQDQPAFHVVCPSLLGYTFSDGTTNKVTQVSQIAYCADNLMKTLGYRRYVAQGGDWGSHVTRALATDYDACLAIHLNFFKFDPSGVQLDQDASDTDKRGYKRWDDFARNGTAYAMMQGTTPHTLGSALATSPLALVTYIGEKFSRWTAPEATSGDTSTLMDDVITGALLYWFSGSITSSFMLYANVHYGSDALEHEGGSGVCKVVSKPVGFTGGPYEIGWVPEKTFKQYHSDTRLYEIAAKGGHFLAMEQPSLLAQGMQKHFGQSDIKQFFSE